MTGLIYIDTAMRASGAYAWSLIEARPVDALNIGIYREYIGRRRNGAMTWAARYMDVRDNPRLLFAEQGGPEVECLLICLFAYPAPRQIDSMIAVEQRGLIADYARAGVDYHRVVRARLADVAAMIAENTRAITRIYCDTAPLRERYWAARAGLGDITRNNQLVVPGVGSSFHIAAIAIGGGEPRLMQNMLRQVKILRPIPVAPCPPGCTLCRDACPTGALCGDGSCDVRKCVSYLTIEAPTVTAPLHPLATGYAVRGKKLSSFYGCDICRRVCPFTKNSVDVQPVDELRVAPEAVLTTTQLNAMTAGQFKRLLPQSAIQRPGLKRLRRNL